MIKKIAFTLFLFTQLATFTQNYDFGKVSKEELQEQFYPLDSTADAAYLYRSRKTHFDYDVDDGFRTITEVHNRIKIYNKDGFKNGTQEVVLYKPLSGKKEKFTNLKAYTFNLIKNKIVKTKVSKKSIFEERKNKYYVIQKIPLPNIKENSVIDIKYNVISPFRSIDDLKFQFEIPIKKLNYSVAIPDYFKYKEYIRGYYQIKPIFSFINKDFQFETPDKKVSKSGGYVTEKGEVFKLNVAIKQSLFKADNIPALKEKEAFIGNIENYRGAIIYELASSKLPNSMEEHYADSWENISKKIYRSGAFGDELTKSSYYSDDIENLLKSANNEFEKVAILFQFVKSKVKWNGYYGKYTENGVRKAYRENTGNVADVNLMLTSMLRFAGLDANPVLVSSRGNGIPLFPTIKGFDYVIAAVTFNDGKYVLLDATEPYSLPNTLPERALNWNGRLVKKDGSSSWLKLITGKHSLEENMLMVKINDELVAEGFIRTKFDNIKALNFRRSKNHIKEEILSTNFEENNNVEIEDFKLQNKLDLNKPIVRMIKFSSEDLIEGINGKLYIEPLLFLTRHNNPFKLEERKFPIDFTTSWKELNRVTITIPNGYKVEKLPETLAIGLPEDIGVFKYQVSQVGNKIKSVSVLQFNKPLIGAQYYKDLKNFFDETVRKQSEKIVLIKQ
jgi:hypothetical protein